MMKLATLAAVGVIGVGLVAAPVQPAKAWCGALLPLCVAGAVVGTAAVVATAPFAYAAAPPPAYYAPPAPAYGAPYAAPAPVYAAPAPAYYGYPGYGYYGAPVVAVGVGPVWWHGHWVRRPYRRWHY